MSALVLSVGCAWLAPRAAAAHVLVLDGVTVIDGTGAPPRPDVSVVIDDARIVAVGPRQELTWPSDATVENARGQFLIPGLIDMHVHALIPRCGPTGQWSAELDRPLSERMLKVLLAFGITTVRSPATPTRLGLPLRDDLAAGRIMGPRLFAAGELINGWPRRAGDVKDEIRAQLPYRPDFIKLYAGLSPEAVQAGIEEAHAHGLRVIGHLGRTSWTEAARMGIDFLTHAASWSAGELPPAKRDAYAQAQRTRGPMRSRVEWLEWLDLDGPEITTLVAELARRRIPVDPTLVVYDSKFLPPDHPRYRGNPNRAVVPEMLAGWQRCGTLTEDWTADDYRRMAAAWPKMLALVRKFHRAGVPLLAGTDVTNSWVIPGESLHQELELLVASGIPPLEVLRIATSNGAEALGIGHETGTIAPGKRADLVLLRADPTAAIANTRSILWVMQNGARRIPSGLLSATR